MELTGRPFRVGIPKHAVPFSMDEVERLLGHGTTVIPYSSEDLSVASSSHLQRCHALVLSGDRLTAEHFSHLSELKMISVPGTGIVDYVDIPSANAHSIAVARVRDYATDSVAELTIGLLICLVRHIPAAIADARRGASSPWTFEGSELRGLTMGIIGFGGIGRRVASMALELGMTVLASSRRGKIVSTPTSVRHVTLKELLYRADAVSIHTLLTPETRGMIGHKEFGLMRRQPFFINTARGSLVQSDALIAALESGSISGAALDVTDPEPLPPRHTLLRLPNVLVTPHIGAMTSAAQRRAYREALSNVRCFLEEEPFDTANPEVLK